MRHNGMSLQEERNSEVRNLALRLETLLQRYWAWSRILTRKNSGPRYGEPVGIHVHSSNKIKILLSMQDDKHVIPTAASVKSWKCISQAMHRNNIQSSGQSVIEMIPRTGDTGPQQHHQCLHFQFSLQQEKGVYIVNWWIQNFILAVNFKKCRYNVRSFPSVSRCFPDSSISDLQNDNRDFRTMICSVRAVHPDQRYEHYPSTSIFRVLPGVCDQVSHMLTPLPPSLTAPSTWIAD